MYQFPILVLPEVRVGPIENRKSVYFYYGSHMDLYAVGTDLHSV